MTMSLFKQLVLTYAILQTTTAFSYIKKHIHITPIIIWEGQEILQHNVSSIEQFRKSLGYAPILHFISPDYFKAREHKKNRIKAASILGAIKAGDHVGVYYRPELCKKIRCIKKSRKNNLQTDSEIIINTSEKLIEKFGIKTSKFLFLENQYFSKSNLEIFEKIGYLDIYGPTNPSLLSLRKSFAANYNLEELISNYYMNLKQSPAKSTPKKSVIDQVDEIKAEKSKLTIHPINGGMVDINTDDQIFNALSEQWYQQAIDSSDDVFEAKVIFHQESAAHFLPRIKLLLRRIYDYASEKQLLVSYGP